MTRRILSIWICLLLLAGCDLLGDLTNGSEDDTTPPADVGFLAGAPGNRQVELSWANPSDQDFSHVIIDCSSSPPMDLYADGDINAVIVAGLTNGTPYSFTVYTVDASDNRSTGSNVEVTPTATIPDDVSDLAAVPGIGEVTLSWVNPASVEFSQLEITYSPGGEARPILLGPTNTAVTIPNLTIGTEYTFAVRLADIAGNRSTGASASATPAATADSTPPGGVSNLAAVPGNAFASLTWEDPTDEDLNYIAVTHDQAGGNVPIVVSPGTGMVAVTGLANGVPHDFSLVAVDESGNESAPETATVTPTGDHDADPPGECVPGTVIEGNGYILLNWTDPTDSDFNHVQITHDQTGGDQIIYIGAGSESGVITGLTNGTTYTFTIKSVDVTGNKSAGVQVTGTPTTNWESVDIAISINTPGGVPVGLTGGVPTLNKDMYDQMTVVSDITDADSYTWYLDGSVVGDNQNQVVVESQSLAVSIHELFLVVEIGGSLHSAGVQFEVVQN